MKRISYLFSLLLLMTFVAFTSCKKTEPEVLKTPAQEAAEKLIGTYTVTNVTRSDNATVDLEGQTVTLTFAAKEDGTGGTFTSSNAGVLPGDADLPASGTWAWSGSNFKAVVINGTTLNFTSALDADPIVFTYAATDAKGNFTATVTADEND